MNIFNLTIIKKYNKKYYLLPSNSCFNILNINKILKYNLI